MKRILLSAAALAIAVLCVLAGGCSGIADVSNPGESESGQVSTDPSEASDASAPVLRITAAAATITINQGAELNLLAGVTGTDDVDGNITDRIRVDTADFDPDVPGVYVITYYLTDSDGNEAEPVTRTVTVLNTGVLEEYPIYTGEIEGEILNPDAPTLFGGAWYHKVVSSKDSWVGIEATVTLPEVYIRRYSGEYDDTVGADPDARNLDNPSVYLGGNAGSESDVGLSYSRALVDVNGQVLSTGCIAFRPFWRYITSVNKDEGGYDVHGGEYAVSANGDNCIANYHWRYTKYYYLPGDTLRIIIYIPEPGKMQLQIEVIEVSTLESSVAIRERYGWDDPADFKSPVFAAPGHGTGAAAEYKRVNAIDQEGNEGGTAIVSDTEVIGAVWHSTYLYREIDGVIYRVPMGESRRGVLDAPEADRFTVVANGGDAGAETVSIHPGYAD